MTTATRTFPRKVVEFYERNKHRRPRPERLEGRDGQWIFYHSELPWVRLPDFPHEQMFREASQWIDRMVPQEYDDLFADDPNDPTPDQVGWNTICIYGISATAYDRGFKYGYAHEDEVPSDWTEVAETCPTIKEFVQELPYEKIYRARLTVLLPGGYAKPHIGRKKSTSSARKTNFALNQVDGFHFLLEDQGPIPWEAGRGFFIKSDDHYHTVFNPSDEPRIHLIVMGVPDFSKLSPLLEKGYYSEDPLGYEGWEMRDPRLEVVAGS